MARKRKSRRKIETSKLLLCTVLPFFAVLEIVVIIGWLAFGREDAAGLAGVFIAPIGTVIGFYTWKAKNENMQKYGYKVLPGDENEDEC